ncbi:hypothetical protein EMPS_04171 [Entomortierella parvispora]|uniref:Fcf2 pre-rRNA processing C-terminal domain-containing protein n=1 Tax=Entomortierella parvispora TaxID=205924 RepID=A0A9P3LVB5_9FUNG|nr:hypothetical protein EMPS_04171 [Entomortierella parvispora]
MVTTRNRSRTGQATVNTPELVELPTRTRRTRQSKQTAAHATPESISVNESESPESSTSSTPSAEYMTPPQELRNAAESEEQHQYESSEKATVSEDESEHEEQDEHSSSEDDEDEDLDELLLKAQASLKRKASGSDNKKKEPLYNFPKLETGLDTSKLYIKQDNKRAKVDMSTVVVVDKGVSKTKSGAAPTLETCEVSKNIEKAHISKKQKKEEKEKTTGKGWFDLPQQIITPELKRDLQILKLRNVLDPKRFYKREDKSKPKFPKYFQVGTIIEGNTEFYSSRLTKKERATTITGEVMKDLTGRDYYKRKFNEIQEAKQSGGKRFNKKGKGKQSKSWRAGK